MLNFRAIKFDECYFFAAIIAYSISGWVLEAKNKSSRRALAVLFFLIRSIFWYVLRYLLDYRISLSSRRDVDAAAQPTWFFQNEKKATNIINNFMEKNHSFVFTSWLIFLLSHKKRTVAKTGDKCGSLTKNLHLSSQLCNKRAQETFLIRKSNVVFQN